MKQGWTNWIKKQSFFFIVNSKPLRKFLCSLVNSGARNRNYPSHCSLKPLMWKILCYVEKKESELSHVHNCKRGSCSAVNVKVQTRDRIICVCSVPLFSYSPFWAAAWIPMRITTVCIALDIVPSLTCIKLIGNFSPHIIIVPYCSQTFLVVW